jgi:superfamily I DNA/RNA helicase
VVAKLEIVLGPPGTGKTTTLISIVERELAAGTHPERIAYLSFTRRAADEAITRACDKFGKERSEFIYFRTLHSLCFRFLGLSSSDVLEGKKLKEFGEQIGMPITGRWTQEGTIAGNESGDRMLFMENLARVRRAMCS